MKNKKVLAMLILLSMTSILVNGCGEAKESAQEEEILSVEVINPTTANVSVESEFVGNLEFVEQTAVIPKMSGEVTEVFFEEGDYVNEGDLLFTMDDEALQMGLETAQAQYKNAKAGTDQQLGAIQMTINSNLNNIKSAEEGMSQLRDTYDYYERQAGYLEASEEILADNLDDAKHDKKKAKKQLKEAKEAAETLKKAGMSSADLEKSIAGLESAIAGYESAIDQYNMNINQYNQNEDTMCYQKNNLIYQYQQAERGLALAQENLAYYLTIQAPAIQEAASASLKLAQVGIDSAKMQLGFSQVTAPVSGVIQSKNVSVHGMAAAGTPAYVIINDGGMNATFNVPESTYKVLSEGQSVKVVRNGQTYYGVITELPTQVDMQSGLFKITAKVSGDTSELKSGTSVEVYTVTNHSDNTMTIPVDTIYYEGGSAFVYTNVKGEVQKCYVETGLHDDEKIEILSGLEDGTEIITTWSSELRNGLKINATKEETSKEAE